MAVEFRSTSTVCIEYECTHPHRSYTCSCSFIAPTHTHTQSAYAQNVFHSWMEDITVAGEPSEVAIEATDSPCTFYTAYISFHTSLYLYFDIMPEQRLQMNGGWQTEWATASVPSELGHRPQWHTESEWANVCERCDARPCRWEIRNGSLETRGWDAHSGYPFDSTWINHEII